MRNPHGVEPTRFMKREESRSAILCNFNYGPTFGDDGIGSDICIRDNCNRENSCSINNDGRHGYECDSQYMKTLFVNTNSPDYSNRFTVFDYEVFGIDYENRENINKLCKHSDIILEYTKTKDISEESLKQVDDVRGLLSDLDAISCVDINIRLKISQYNMKKSSKLFPNSQLVNQQYDSKLREWLGNDYKWKLLYRASEHGYSGKSFHEYCDDKRPTLVVIKSSEGWIFGGYTTQSWKVVHPNEYGSIYIDMIYYY